ncbi:MAG: FkbM family methyltransferase [Hormoscilla sp.]
MSNKLKSKVSQILYHLKTRPLLAYRQVRQPQVVKIAGIKIPISDRISGSPLKYLYMGSYENHELKLVKSQLQKDDIVMELGTGLGLISSYCAKKIGSDRVFTYEANPALEPDIRHAYTLNKVDPTLEICLLGEQPGEQTFYVGNEFWSSSIIKRDADFQGIKVPVKSFNQEVQKINPTFIIIDIEGGEYGLLKSADFHNVRKLIIELHERVIGKEKIKFVKSKLKAAGFQVVKKISYKEELFCQRS